MNGSTASYSGNFDATHHSTAGPSTNIGPPLPKSRPRCGCCGRFVRDGWPEYDEHLERSCPSPCYFNGHEKRPLRRLVEDQ